MLCPKLRREICAFIFLNLRLKLLLKRHSLYFTAPSSPILKLLLNVAHWRMSSLVHAPSGSATRFPPLALVRISPQMDFVRRVSFYSRRTRCQSPVSTRMAGLHNGFEPIGFVEFSKLAQGETSLSFTLLD